MRKSAFFVIAAILLLCICCPRPERMMKKKAAQTEEHDSREEEIKEALAVYLKDSISEEFYEYAMNHSVELGAIWNISPDSMKTVYDANIDYVDSLVRAAFALMDEGRLKEWWEQIDEQTMAKFYTHPANIMGNELKLHKVMRYLNNKFLDEQTALEREIKLWTFSDIHCSIVETMDESNTLIHLVVLENLAYAYAEAGDTAQAMETAERFGKIYHRYFPDDSTYVKQMFRDLRGEE